MTSPVPVAISGGPGGLVANREAIAHLAGLFARTAEACGIGLAMVRAEENALALRTGDYGSTGLLDHVGLARASELVSDAARVFDGGLAIVTGLAARLRSSAQGYPWGTDALDTGILGEIENRLMGLVEGSWWLNRTAAGAIGVDLPEPGRPDERVAGLDPRTVDLLVDAVDLGALSSVVAGSGVDGTGVPVPTGRRVVAAPRSLAEVLDGLADVNGTGVGGGIDVRVLTGADGRRRAIVNITGTRTWGDGGRDPADLRTNAASLLGHPGAYSQGVLAALRRAGVRSDEPVMLVGHSQGGMVATIVAHEASVSKEFAVTHVVTAGSPVGRTVGGLPSSVRVLALENTHDLVPFLDGRPNPDLRNVTTVSGPAGDGSVGDSHSIEQSYRPIAAAAERAGGSSMRDYLGSAGDFFTAERADQHGFRIERR